MNSMQISDKEYSSNSSIGKRSFQCFESQDTLPTGFWDQLATFTTGDLNTPSSLKKKPIVSSLSKKSNLGISTDPNKYTDISGLKALNECLNENFEDTFMDSAVTFKKLKKAKDGMTGLKPQIVDNYVYKTNGYKKFKKEQVCAVLDVFDDQCSLSLYNHKDTNEPKTDITSEKNSFISNDECLQDPFSDEFSVLESSIRSENNGWMMEESEKEESVLSKGACWFSRHTYGVLDLLMINDTSSSLFITE